MSAEEWLAERARIEQAATEGPWETGNYWGALTHGPDGVIGAYYGEECPACDESLDAEAEVVVEVGDLDWIADARTALPKALDALGAVLALHRPHVCGEVPLWQLERGACFIGNDGCLSVGTCRDCQMPYPCPTVTQIQEALNARA